MDVLELADKIIKEENRKFLSRIAVLAKEETKKAEKRSLAEAKRAEEKKKNLLILKAFKEAAIPIVEALKTLQAQPGSKFIVNDYIADEKKPPSGDQQKDKYIIEAYDPSDHRGRKAIFFASGKAGIYYNGDTKCEGNCWNSEDYIYTANVRGLFGFGKAMPERINKDLFITNFIRELHKGGLYNSPTP